MNLIWILFAHFIGDFALQNDYIATNKAKNWYIMLSHCMIWTACISIALEYVNLCSLEKITFLLITHYIIDLFKITWIKECPNIPNNIILFNDQILHLIQCCAVVYWNYI